MLLYTCIYEKNCLPFSRKYNNIFDYLYTEILEAIKIRV